MQSIKPIVTSVALDTFRARVTPMTGDEVIAYMSSEVPSGSVKVIANHNLHSLYLHETDRQFRAFYETCDVILIDGFPVLLAAKFTPEGRKLNVGSQHRLGSLDWILRTGEVGSVQKLAVVGASPEANTRAVAKIQDENPRLTVKGWHGQGWDLSKEEIVIAGLNAFRPDLTLVALGMPLQESFLARNFEVLPAGIYATVGGAVDQLAGVQRGAPRWLGRYGLEWVWRLASQPKRLAYRYLVEPWKLVFFVAQRQHKGRSGGNV